MSPHFKGPCRLHKSSTASAPKYKALLIGIDYTSPAEDIKRGYRQLKNPVNDAKEVKQALIELFHYKEEDICLMTDEDANSNTALWPSEANILKALDSFVHGASPGDAFVFSYAGHCGQQPATIDPNEVDGLDEFIVTRDFKKILDNTLRRCLVDPLPQGTRLTAILDCSHSGTLLDLDHYSCNCFLPRGTQSLMETMAVDQYDRPSRRHTDDTWERRLVRSATQISRTTSSGAVTAALATVRLRTRLARKQKQPEVVDDSNDSDDAAPRSPGGTIIPRSSCSGGSYCAYALLNGPLVISVSSCADHEVIWEDSQNKGRSMTSKLVQILRKNPSVKVGELDTQLKRKFFRMSLERMLEVKRAFKRYSAKLSPELRDTYEDKYTKQGRFQLREQTPQIKSTHCLRRDDEFIVKRTRTIDLWS